MTTVLVASPGGHIAELHELIHRLPVDDDRVWVTSDTPQTRDLLVGEEVAYAPNAGSRDLLGTVKDARFARRFLHGRQVEEVISTGASIAAAFFPIARSRGIPCHYIESAARVNHPSVTGRMMSAVPGVHLYCQNPISAHGKWLHSGSVFDSFGVVDDTQPDRLDRVVVTFGIGRRYGFRRLVERLVPLLSSVANVFWQVGATDVSGLDIDARRFPPADEFAAAMLSADVVITHAGVGSALSALHLGHRPVFVPRRSAYGENVDDHQVALAAVLGRRGLVVDQEADHLTMEDLLAAAGSTIVRRAEQQPFPLVGHQRVRSKVREIRLTGGGRPSDDNSERALVS